MESFETCRIDNESYHVFCVRRENNSLIIDFIWGKTDFRCRLNKETARWERAALFLIKNSRYYRYARISEHGIVYDEFQWISCEGEDIYIELPKDFPSKSDQVCREVVKKRGWRN